MLLSPTDGHIVETKGRVLDHANLVGTNLLTVGYRMWNGYKGLWPYAIGGDAPIDILFAREKKTPI